MATTNSEWHKTACILCSVNCGIEVQLDGRRIARVRGDKAQPALAGLHLREGAAARPLPERARPPDHAAAPARRRQLRADRLGHRDRRDRRASSARVRDTLRRRAASSITAAAARGIISAAATRRRRARRSARSTRSNALAQEKTGEFWVDGQLFGRPRCHTTGDFEHAEVAVFVGKNPWQSHGFPRARAIAARDRRRSQARADRHRPAPHRDRRARRLSICRCGPGTDAFLPQRAARRAGRGGSDRPRLPRRAHGQRRPRCSRCCAPCRSPTTAARAGVAEELRAHGRPPHRRRRERVDLRGPRHPAGAAQHAQLVPREAASTCSPATSRSRAAMNIHTTMAGLGGGKERRARPRPVGGHRIITGLIPVQRHPRRDPHRSSRSASAR